LVIAANTNRSLAPSVRPNDIYLYEIIPILIGIEFLYCKASKENFPIDSRYEKEIHNENGLLIPSFLPNMIL
jgi:hypothetical protein